MTGKGVPINQQMWPEEEDGKDGMAIKNKEKKAPIILFVYNRLYHTKKIIEALKSCEESVDSELFIFSDGAKDATVEEGVKEVREYLQTINGFKKVTVYEKTENWGIEKSEIQGITSIIGEYGRAIVLEDDIVVAPCFLRYMNLALEKYRDCKEVYSVTGYSFLNAIEADGLPEYGFLPLTSVWGWATWKEKWDLFQQKIEAGDIRKLLNKEFRKKFDRGYKYADMLYSQYKAGYITWDIAWYWTVYIHGGLTLAPAKTMVNNIGMDGSGVHYTDKNGKSRIENIDSYAYSDDLPDRVVLTKEYCDVVERALQKMIVGNHGKGYKVWMLLKDALRWKKREVLFKWEHKELNSQSDGKTDM